MRNEVIYSRARENRGQSDIFDGTDRPLILSAWRFFPILERDLGGVGGFLGFFPGFSRIFLGFLPLILLATNKRKKTIGEMAVPNMQCLKQLATNSRVSVIGGGISGLSFAYFLGKLRPDVKVTVYEQQGRVGGYIQTSRANEQTQKQTGCVGERALKMEKGPRTLRGVSPGTLILVDLLKKMGRLGQLRGVHLGSKGNRKYLVKRYADGSAQMGQVTGELIEVPGPGCRLSTVGKFLASDLGRIGVAGFVKDLFFRPDVGDDKRLENMSVEEFFTRHFGRRMITDIGSALMYGIYAADVADLNVQSVMPGLVELERQDGSVARSMLKRMFRPKQEQKGSSLDEDLQLYVDRLGSDFDLANLAVLLKKFPMLALTDGLSALCEGLRGSLPENVKVVTDSGVEKICAGAGIANGGAVITFEDGSEEACDHVRSTASAHVFGSLVSDTEPELAQQLAEFRYTSVTVCNVLIPQRDVKQYEGFGFLVPKASFSRDARVMGVIFDSDVEEHSSVLFPGGGGAHGIPTVLTAPSPADGKTPSADETTDAVRAVERDIVRQEHSPPGSADFTKVTFMLNVAGGRAPTVSQLRQVVAETFANLLGGGPLPASWALERTTLRESIPLYDVAGEGFPRRRAAVETAIGERFGGRVSVGGMTFARGIGVPDAVVSSLRAAAVLAGEVECK